MLQASPDLRLWGAGTHPGLPVFQAYLLEDAQSNDFLEGMLLTSRFKLVRPLGLLLIKPSPLPAEGQRTVYGRTVCFLAPLTLTPLSPPLGHS